MTTKTGVKKDLFLSLLIFTLIITILLTAVVWYFNLTGWTVVTQSILLLLTIVISLLTLIILLGTLSLFWPALPQTLTFLYWPTRIVINYLLVPILFLGKLFGFNKLEIQNSFIQLNNQFAKSAKLEVRAEQILLLLPHCIQDTKCEYRITTDLDNCRRCGNCPVFDILDLRDRYGINVAVATGGTLARRLVKELRPRIILAVACERDLSSGIQDVYPLPVLGVVNERPEGPCINTLVDIDSLEEALNNVLGLS